MLDNTDFINWGGGGDLGGVYAERNYFSNLKFDVAISPIPTMPSTMLTGDEITPKNNNVAEVNAIASPARNIARLRVFIVFLCI